MQQHQLRLHFHIKTACGIKQIQQHMTKGNFTQRLGKNRITDRADRLFKLLHVGIFRNPTGIHMQLRHPLIITIEKRQKIFCQITFIFTIQRTDNATINADILRIFWVLRINKNIAGVHIGMEKAITENLGEKHLHATFCQQFHISAVSFQCLNIRNLNPVNPLHHNQIAIAKIVIHFRNIQHRAIFKIAPQLNRICHFAP